MCGKGAAVPEGAVHVINVDARELPREFRRGELLEFLEHLVLGLVLSVIAGCVDQEAKRSMPQTASNLRGSIRPVTASLSRFVPTLR